MLPDDPYERGWVVGVFEVEGSTGFSDGEFRVGFRSTVHSTVERLHRAVPAFKRYGPYQNRRKPSWTLLLRGEDAVTFATDLVSELSEEKAAEIRSKLPEYI